MLFCCWKCMWFVSPLNMFVSTCIALFSCNSEYEGDEGLDYAPPPCSSYRRQCASSSSGSSSPDKPTKRDRGRCCGPGRRGQASKRPKLAAGDFEPQQGRWRTKEEPDVEPRTPRFEPKHQPGPRIDTTADWSPLRLFKLFFSSSSLHTMINNTNANAVWRLAQGSKEKVVSPLSLLILHLSFHHPLLWLGKCALQGRFLGGWSGRTNLFSPRAACPGISLAIFWSLHLSDVTEDEDNERKREAPQFDRLFRIKPLYGKIVNAWDSLFQLYQNITIDERMVASKARIGFRQYMKDKPTKFGYKLFVLADPKTDYTSNFFYLSR